MTCCFFVEVCMILFGVDVDVKYVKMILMDFNFHSRQLFHTWYLQICMVDTVILYIQQSPILFTLKTPGFSPDVYNLKIGSVVSTAITAAVDWRTNQHFVQLWLHFCAASLCGVSKVEGASYGWAVWRRKPSSNAVRYGQISTKLPEIPPKRGEKGSFPKFQLSKVIL